MIRFKNKLQSSVSATCKCFTFFSFGITNFPFMSLTSISRSWISTSCFCKHQDEGKQSQQMSQLPWLLAECRKLRRMPCRICHRAPPGGSPAPSCPWLRGRGAAPCLCPVVSGHPGQPRVIVTKGQPSSDLYRPPARTRLITVLTSAYFFSRQGYTLHAASRKAVFLSDHFNKWWQD